MKSFGLTPDQTEFLKKSLSRYLLESYPATRVWVFGSRARGTHKPASDLDLLLENDVRISPLTLAALRDCFEESSFPYKLDLVLSQDLAESYRTNITRDRVEFYWR